MSQSKTEEKNTSSLAELKAKIDQVVQDAKLAERLQRQAAKQALRGIVTTQKTKLAIERRKILREHQRQGQALQHVLGATMLEIIAEHGVDDACMTMGDFKSMHPDQYEILLRHLAEAKEIAAEKKELKKKVAPEGNGESGESADRNGETSATTAATRETH